MIGLARGTVQVVPYQSSWPELFSQEAARLRAALGGAISQIEHVGSTAVPGLSAKPIIDLLAVVPSLSGAHALVPDLERLAYEHRPDVPSPSRLFFAQGPGTGRTHYLSLAEVGSVAWHDQIEFRDHLRSHRGAAAEYAVLKDRLALQFPSDRSAYTTAKEHFIQHILSERRRHA